MRLEIRWKGHFQDTEYGMVGEIKAFSVVDHGYEDILYPRLPDRKGMTQAEKFPSTDKAKARAEVLLGEFLTLFLAGSKPASKAS
ncbi:hypothetical protein [Nonomuraea typhae]|uniref:hypothetical protein n=1 Tax=Nonomuraea typhae TaxID=2603600 RepID=UPI0012FAE820|nr:hypothetical protein [Nonomuraea typhae]